MNLNTKALIHLNCPVKFSVTLLDAVTVLESPFRMTYLTIAPKLDILGFTWQGNVVE